MSAVLNTPQLSLRPMREEDLDAVSVIEARCYPYPWSRRIFCDCLRVGYSCWIMQSEGSIAGYGILSAAAGEAHILNVCVDQPYRGLGWGRMMTQRLLNMARWFHSERVFLEVRPSNRVAVYLYERLGFEIVGSRAGYYPAEDGREDALVMALSLNRKDNPRKDNPE